MKFFRGLRFFLPLALALAGCALGASGPSDPPPVEVNNAPEQEAERPEMGAAEGAPMEPTPTEPTPTEPPPTELTSPEMPSTAAAPAEMAATGSLAVGTASPMGFQFHANNPLVPNGEPGSWDSVYMDPGGIVLADGMFHMFYNGIDGFPKPVGVGYATSPDGLTWTRQSAEPLFTVDDLHPDDDTIINLFVTSALVVDGTWILYYYTLAQGDFIGPQFIYRATAPAPTGPWTADPEPALRPGPEGAWDALQVGSADVQQTEGGFQMYYDGMGLAIQNNSWIGMATSEDGIHWTKHKRSESSDAPYAESDPVLIPAEEGWDSRRVMDPNVVERQNGEGPAWQMVYLSTNGERKFAGSFWLGLAVSEDGVEWRRVGAAPLADLTDFPGWQATYLLTLIDRGEAGYLYFDHAGDSGTSIYLATFPFAAPGP